MRQILIYGIALVWLSACASSTTAIQAISSDAALDSSLDTVATTGVAYPANYRDEFVQYVTVDRKDAVVRHIFINPDAVMFLRRGFPLPDNTIIVIEAFDAQVDENGDPLTDDQGRFIPGEALEMVHVAQKRSNWQEADFPSTARAGQWNFGSFQYGTGNAFEEDLNACFNCHQATPGTDFLYTGRLLARFSTSNEPLYTYCDLTRRTPCN